ncbi:MAG: NADH-quinone oxidoreductase subunit NuoH [Acidobacteria bacterium]|nr:NADH-quinone oxidoreductase subunit NuoH [Acidobacteriota bacterium]
MSFYTLAVVKALVLLGILLITLVYIQWVERKLIAHIQGRWGPNRVGPHGLLQPIADSLKLLTKEDLTPPHVHKLIFVMAPFLAVSLALISIAVIPFGGEVEVFGVRTTLQLTDLNIGLLFIFAVTSLGVYGIALGGWASNNKYSLFGALRSSAQMLSYELSLSLGVVGVLLLSGSLSLRRIVDSQAGYYFGFLPRWNVFHGPLPQLVGFLVYLTAAFAETNRVPFDLPEAETELVAGFHTEYSSMKFALFFMAEYANMITVACLATVLFFGGWHAPLPESWGIQYAPLVVGALVAGLLLYHSQGAFAGKQRRSMQVFGVVAALIGAAFLLQPVRVLFSPLFWFAAKSGFFLFLYIWVRGTLPRFRYDQLMGFGWKVLFPVGVANVLVTALMVALFG